MAVTVKKLQAAISEILDGANLDEVTQKGVRKQLEEKLGVDLTDRRKEVDELIMNTLNEKRDGSEEEEEESEEEEKKPAKRGRKAAPAAKNGGSDSGSEDEPAGKKAKKAPAAKKGGGKKAGTGYTKECKLSAELAAVMGQPTMARHEVVKQMWKLVKEKNLYDPKNKQFAICNDELFKVFGVKRFRTFGMMKYLKNHFLD